MQFNINISFDYLTIVSVGVTPAFMRTAVGSFGYYLNGPSTISFIGIGSSDIEIRADEVLNINGTDYSGQDGETVFAALNTEMGI